jgi:signal transduction histidine kinase
VIKEVLNSESQGFSAVCNKYFNDSKSREDFFRTFIENIRILEDSTIYIYIYDTNFVNIAHPILKNYIGQNHYDDKDVKGQFISHIIQDTLRASSEGFVEFYFNNPKTQQNEKKISFVKNIENSIYWLGCGVYSSTLQGWSITKSDVNKLIVKNCVHTTATGFNDLFENLVKSDSNQLKFIRNYCDSTRFLKDKSGYFFVDDLTGRSISYPTRKDLEGTDLTGIKDFKGVYPVVEMLKVINSAGMGFVEYYLENPTTKQVQKKIVYVEKIPNTNYFIGCGYYE